MKLYKAYRFLNKDPVIDELRTMLQDTLGRKAFKQADLAKVEADGGPSVSASSNWFFGDTKRPQSATVEAFGRALGYQRVWLKIK